MTTGPRQPDDPNRERTVAGRPDQIDELDLLGWVEGDLPRARQHPVEALLAREPRLRHLLDAMAEDRAAIRSLGVERAPADLLAGVEARLERDLLVGLSGADSPVPELPVSRVVIRHDGVLARITRSPLVRVSAVAAALLIVGAVGIVMLPDRAPRPHLQRAAPPVLLGAGASDSQEIALAAAPQSNLQAADSPAPAPLLSTLAGVDPAADALSSPTTNDISPERAAELIRERRLVLVIRTLDQDRTLQRLAAIHAEPRPSWMILDRADAILVASLDPKPDPSPAIDPSAMASGRSAPIPRPVTPTPPPPTPQRAVYLAEADATPRALAALRGVLGSGRTQVARFVALDAPLPTPEANSIESVIWWDRPPTGWVHRYTLPVVIEPVDPR